MSELRTEISRRRTLAIIVPQKLALLREPGFAFAPGGVTPPFAKVLPWQNAWTAQKRRGSKMAHTLIFFWRIFHV